MSLMLIALFVLVSLPLILYANSIEQSSLSDILRLGAGLYASKSPNNFHDAAQTDKTVLVTAFNWGYIGFLHNFKVLSLYLTMLSGLYSISNLQYYFSVTWTD